MDPHRYVNPYIAGSPVTGTEMFFGREDVFSFIERNLIGRHRDTPIVLYGQRRTGKTSVLYQLHRHLDPRYRCIFIDLHGLSLDGVGNLMWGIAHSISRGLRRDYQLIVGIPDRAEFFADPMSVFEAVFLDAVWSVLGDDDHLVLMIDEVVRLDEEVRAGRLERQVFDYLRHLMQHFARLNFIFSLGSGLEEMEKDYAFLFSVSLYHRISFLEPTAARALITQPVKSHYQVMKDAVEKILQITSGHPYYTQLVCHCMFDRWARSPKPAMTVADVDAVLAEAIELGSANLTYVWEESTAEEQAMMAGMAAVMHSRNRPVTVDHVREAWRKVGVSLPEGDVAMAIRSLTGREVVAGERTYSFAVDLQRRWLDKHRRLDWVKGELAEAVRQWDRSAEAGPGTRIAALPREHEQSGAAGGQRSGPGGGSVGGTVVRHIQHWWRRRSSRKLLVAAASVLAVVTIVTIVVALIPKKAVPTSADSTLEGLIPGAIRAGNCQDVNPPGFSAIAEIDCSKVPNIPANGVYYYLFADSAALNNGYGDFLGEFAHVPEGAGNCTVKQAFLSFSPPCETSWNNGDSSPTEGQMVEYDYGGTPKITTTFNSNLVLIDLKGRKGNGNAMLAWWNKLPSPMISTGG